MTQDISDFYLILCMSIFYTSLRAIPSVFILFTFMLKYMDSKGYISHSLGWHKSKNASSLEYFII